MNAVEINGLTKFYGKSRGIVDLSLTVAEGEFFGFIGPNGAGKSTTVRTLLGLIKSSGGSAKIFGADIVSQVSLDLPLIALGAVYAIAGTAAGFIKYSRKDIK